MPLIDPKSKFSKSNYEREQSVAEQAKKEVELADLDWEDRERVLRLMFSKMNSGQPPSNWRLMDTSRSNNERGTATTKQRLNQSFREEEEDEEGYGEEEGVEKASNTNIFRKTNAEDYGGQATAKGSTQWTH